MGNSGVFVPVSALVSMGDHARLIAEHQHALDTRVGQLREKFAIAQGQRGEEKDSAFSPGVFAVREGTLVMVMEHALEIAQVIII